MLDLGKKQEVFKKVVFDSVSGAEVELFHRAPTTPEEVEFQRRTFKRRGDKRKITPDDIARNLAEIRLEFGLKILLGFKEGDFGVDGKPISSDPDSPNFRSDWKELLKENAFRIVSGLATAVFEGGRVQSPDEEGEEETEDPFKESSGDS